MEAEAEIGRHKEGFTCFILNSLNVLVREMVVVEGGSLEPEDSQVVGDILVGAVDSLALEHTQELDGFLDLAAGFVNESICVGAAG